MRIIRPYGSSVTERDETGERRRIRPTAAPDQLRDVPAFAGSDQRLVIAQWISVIDKIATKPKGNGGASREQWALRTALGGACWRLIDRWRLLAPADRTEMRALWELRLHPYGNRKWKAKKRNGKFTKPPEPRGRWYAAFLGDTPFGKLQNERKRCIDR
ncbi:hypothetical protein [Paracoccus tegillarcae]|uniref:Uncharacterized protein n=1 Tax=Paracoccus tegillarcae TaxID=1529068 RepID=A0A2K9F3F9_9RHOB|nr:hypothetical protein [Paracoccus tegillarcae]AUH34912.1 hypothetical protein CUV01_17375 [Paracoccus tegillarcae]